MKKYKTARILTLGILMISVILTACSQHTAETNQAKTESETVVDVKETEPTTEKETVKSEATTKKSSNSDTTTKPAEQKSAGQTTTKKQSETNAKKDYTRTTATNHETTKAVATTKKETTTKKQTTTEKPFDINYWVSYAKDYAKSIGLEVNSSASDCWDNPISANSKCVNLKRDIQSRINRYSKDEDITQIWVWAEKTSADSYNIYIGYA